MKSIFTLLLLFTNIFFGFGQQTVGLFQNDSTTLNGYTLIAPFFATNTYLIDNCGELVNEWSASTHTLAASAYLLEDGSLMRTCNAQTGKFVVGGSGGRLERYDWNDNLVWEFDYHSPTYQQHHDIAVMPNGNILILAFDLLTATEAYNAGLDTTLYYGELWSEKVVEVQPIGTDSGVVVWEWRLKDHLIQDIDANRANYGDIKSNRQLVDLNYGGQPIYVDDWFHANSLDYNPDLDQIMIGTRNYSEIWVIDHSTTTLEAQGHTGGNSGMGGDIIYRWGNPSTYRTGGQADRKLYGQHDAHWIPSGLKDAGKIAVFNNGYTAPIEKSEATIFTPPVDANGNYNYTANMVTPPSAFDWTYEMPIFVDFICGLQRLPNGNMLICSGPNANVFELDSADNVVWQYINPIQGGNVPTSQGNIPNANALFRAYRFGTDYPAFVGKTLTPQGALELNPLPSSCVIFDTTTKVSQLPIKIAARVLQNPIHQMLTIENKTANRIIVQVFDMLGRMVFETTTAESLFHTPVSNWANGVYFVTISAQGKAGMASQVVVKE